jgi:hypothetical protein
MYHIANESDNDQLGRLADALIEHCPQDPNFGPPELWPWWTDFIQLAPGRPILPDERLYDDLPEDGLENLSF